jgi:hypothetical protein
MGEAESGLSTRDRGAARIELVLELDRIKLSREDVEQVAPIPSRNAVRDVWLMSSPVATLVRTDNRPAQTGNAHLERLSGGVSTVAGPQLFDQEIGGYCVVGVQQE